jgi:thiosulfate/3-mercaptopyruvate sulfurtransferase
MPSPWNEKELIMARLTVLLAAVSFGGASVAAAAAGLEYPRAQLLIEPAALARPQAASRFVILDARDRKSFEAERIPGARWVDAAAWAKAFGAGQDAKGWSTRIGGLGITRGSKVVVYDDSLFRDAGRVWWILRYWGVDDVRLLNGNFSAWKKARLPTETIKPTPPEPVEFAVIPRPERLATKAQLVAALEGQKLQLVDARSEKEYCGLDKGANKRGGAIPGAKHLEWTDLIDKPTQRFKTPEQLHKLLADAGIELDKPTATYCQSGGRASVMAFGMELMGASQVRNYYASWAEWSGAEEAPIVTHQPAKKSP